MVQKRAAQSDHYLGGERNHNGITWTAKARPITDPAKVSNIVEKFRAKYGAGNVKKYYSKFDVAVEVPLT